MLTQHSLPFAEMLKKEALLSVLETLDGLPVVLLPEPASEIHKLLCCLYNALYVSATPCASTLTEASK
jgi:hypothetical protein